jgi:hypothetical protein
MRRRPGRAPSGLLSRAFRIASIAYFACLSQACSSNDEAGDDGDEGQGAPGCEGRGEPVVVGMSTQSEDGLLTVTLLEGTPLPPVQGSNSWTVEASNGLEPIVDLGDEDDHVIANIFMADHDHNIRKRGIMSAPGVFEFADFSITMSGYWEITIVVEPDMPENADDHEDAVFGFCVES